MRTVLMALMLAAVVPFAVHAKSDTAEAKRVMAQGKKTLQAELTDPESAQFRNLKTRKDLYLCGEVNAKNQMGGYVGFKRFIVMLSVVTFEDGTSAFTDNWLTSCEGYTQDQVDAARARLK